MVVSPTKGQNIQKGKSFLPMVCIHLFSGIMKRSWIAPEGNGAYDIHSFPTKATSRDPTQDWLRFVISSSNLLLEQILPQYR